MAFPFVDGDFTVAVAQGKPRRTYPIRGDTSSFYVEQDFMQYFANFAALALNTVHPDIAACYLVQESPQTDLGGGICRWTRTYAKIPANRIWYETYPYQVPGILQDPLVYAAAISSAAETSAYPSKNTITHTSTTISPYLAVGDLVRIFFPVVTAGVIVERYFDRIVKSANAGAQTFTVDLVPGLATAVNRWFFRVKIRRQPFSQVVLSSVHYDYYLPGVTGGITTVADIPILNPTPIIDPEGNRMESYTEYTTPTLATYRASVVAQDSIVAEASQLHPWMGNIWERITRYVTQI